MTDLTAMRKIAKHILLDYLFGRGKTSHPTIVFNASYKALWGLVNSVVNKGCIIPPSHRIFEGSVPYNAHPVGAVV